MTGLFSVTPLLSASGSALVRESPTSARVPLPTELRIVLN